MEEIRKEVSALTPADAGKLVVIPDGQKAVTHTLPVSLPNGFKCTLVEQPVSDKEPVIE